LQAKIKARQLVDHDAEAVGTIVMGAITAWWIWKQAAGPDGPSIDEDRFVAAWVDLVLRLAPPTPARKGRK